MRPIVAAGLALAFISTPVTAAPVPGDVAVPWDPDLKDEVRELLRELGTSREHGASSCYAFCTIVYCEAHCAEGYEAHCSCSIAYVEVDSTWFHAGAADELVADPAGSTNFDGISISVGVGRKSCYCEPEG